MTCPVCRGLSPLDADDGVCRCGSDWGDPLDDLLALLAELGYQPGPRPRRVKTVHTVDGLL